MKTIVPADELERYVGKPLGHSEWFLIDQARINAFAEVTEDRQFIHVDEEKARHTPFGSTIAHGFLTLSLMSHLVSDCCLLPENTGMVINYGFDKVRFIQPVRVNQRVRATVTPLSVLERAPGQYLIKSKTTVEIEGEDKPALVADWLALAFTEAR